MRIFIVSSKDKMLKDMSTRSQNKYVLFLLSFKMKALVLIFYKAENFRTERKWIKDQVFIFKGEWWVCGIKMQIARATFELFYSPFCVTSPSGFSLGMS